MAVGDAAGAAGLKTYSDSLLVTDIDVALNQRGDDIAADRTRLKALEAQSIGVPKFSVTRSTNGQNVANNVWTLMTAGAWASPSKNVGGFTWSGGVLKVPKAGVYAVNAAAHFYSDDFYMAGLQITRNSTAVDTKLTIAKGEWSQAPTNGVVTNPSVDATRLLVPLNAGDLLRVFLAQRNNGSNTRNTGGDAYDLYLDVVWQDSL